MTASDHQGPAGLLGIWVDVPPTLEGAFARWYDEDHLPERRMLPGFRRATRYDAVEGAPNRMALYELEDVSAVRTPEYLHLRQQPDPARWAHVRAGWSGHTRGVYRLGSSRVRSDANPVRIDAPYLMTVRLFVTEGSEAAIREWTDAEHAARQIEVPGVRSYHGYEPVDGPFHFLSVWSLDEPSVGSSAAWNEARNTPWRERMVPSMLRTLRGVYRRV